MIFFYFSSRYTFCQFPFCWESSTMISHRLQMKYTHWYHFVFTVSQFAMLNFHSIMQALIKCSPNVKNVILLQTDKKYAILLHILLQTCQENIYYFERHIKVPGSLTHWKKWYPSLFSSLKMTPFFAAKHWLFSSKQPLFRNKTLTFQSKMKHLFCGKTLTFQPKWSPFSQ